MKFDFGTDEETAQQARHKLDVWKQAFRLDKKLQYKLDRGEETEEKSASGDAAHEASADAPAAKAKVGEKGHAKAKPEAKGKPKTAKAEKPAAETAAATNGANVTLLIRLYFSSHEKLSEQRWFERIPAEEPFKSASPRVIRQGDAEFAESEKHFSDLG